MASFRLLASPVGGWLHGRIAPGNRRVEGARPLWGHEAMSDNNLSASEKREILHIGQTVHRPTHWWTPAVHELLKYLESVGFPYSPRVLGFDEQGREVLSFIEGESGADGWAKITTDEGLTKFAQLLRAYHEAV